ncbi:MAG: stage V sporulation protein AD [Agathobacter sp.]|nr:stage V sporulation protein AD [Agathobacter sp.]
MKQKVGTGSLRFAEAPFILQSGSIVGHLEGEGPIGKMFDVVGEDAWFGCDSWEQAESTLQKEALTIALGKTQIDTSQVDYLFAGDLLGQTIATSFGLKNFQLPLFGLYGACSTCGEALSLAAMTVAADYAGAVCAVTSSHFEGAEKQFRFPIEYANQRPMSATWTVTGSGAFVLGNRKVYMQKKKENVNLLTARIVGITTGKIVDYGIKDSMNMGAAMAPAAAYVIGENLKDFPDLQYDKIVTGDLGTVGSRILCDLLKEEGVDISGIHEDCGVKIFDGKTQGTGAGGSGCGCSASMLSAYYLPRIGKGKYKRILFVPTGALLSTVSFNEGQSVPGIAHGVIIESFEEEE